MEVEVQGTFLMDMQALLAKGTRLEIDFNKSHCELQVFKAKEEQLSPSV